MVRQQPKERAWSQAELDALRADPQGFTSRTRSRSAIAAQRFKLGLYIGKPAYQPPPKRFTLAEVLAVLKGATELPGRSRETVASKRWRMGFAKPRPTAWKPAEDEALRANPYGALPGRSRRATYHRRRALGLILPWDDSSRALVKARYGTVGRAEIAQVFPDRSRRSVSAMAHHLGVASDARRTVAWSDPGTLMDAINQEVPAGLPRHVRDELVQMVALEVLEGEADRCELRAVVRRALQRQYRLFPQIGGPLSLDAPTFGDGPPLIERVMQSVWA